MNAPIVKPRRGRPPKNSKENIDTRNTLIRSGLESLTERGYMTSDIESILQAVGIPKGSFYYYFESKESFGREVMSSYACYMKYKLLKSLNNKSLSPLSRLLCFCENTKMSMSKYNFTRGCLVGNLGQEISTLPYSYREILNNIFEDWQHQVEVCLQEAQAVNELNSAFNCKLLSSFFWMSWEGAVMRAKMLQSEEPLNIFIEGFFRGLSH